MTVWWNGVHEGAVCIRKWNKEHGEENPKAAQG